METLKIKSVKIGNYKFEMLTNLRNQPVCTLKQMMTRGKNKDSYKVIESYYFSTEEKRNEYVKNKIERIKKFENEENERKNAKKEALKNFENPFKVGEIFYDSWGWEQTNIDFYQIVEVKNKTVILKSIAQKIVENSEGFMSEYVIPVKDSFNDTLYARLGRNNKEIKKVVKMHISTNGTIGYDFGLSKYNSGERGLYQSHYA